MEEWFTENLRERLSQLKDRETEIKLLQGRIERMEASATGDTDALTGLPGSTYKGAKDAMWADIADARTKVEGMLARAKAERQELLRYISAVGDSRMRQILILRDIERKSWVQVAMEIGGGNTEDSVKKAYYRFLDKD